MTPHVVRNAHEELARDRKAHALAHALEGYARRAKLDPVEAAEALAEHGPDKAWRDLAALAKVNPPSRATIELVVAIVRQNAAPPEGDPFEGL